MLSEHPYGVLTNYDPDNLDYKTEWHLHFTFSYL